MSQPLSPGSQLERGLKTLQRIASSGVMGKDALDNAQKDLFAEFTKRNFENEQSLRPPPSTPPTVPSHYTSTQESVETPTADLDPVEREAAETLQTGFPKRCELSDFISFSTIRPSFFEMGGT
jgi:hypothetical protein